MTDDKIQLVRLSDLDPDFIIDLRYAQRKNFLNKVIYTSNVCYINKHTAKLLIKAKNIFRRDGYRVRIWDAYRPIRAQKKLFELFPDTDYVAKPPDMSKLTSFKPSHMNGMCVDLTLTDMYGNNIKMPTEFDDFSRKSSILYPFTPKEEKNNALYLKFVMEGCGFESYEKEWWHFEDTCTPPVPYSDLEL